MRVLFYLPVVTPWWFDNIIEPMIRICARDAEVHVMAPTIWQNTGVPRGKIKPLLNELGGQYHMMAHDDPHSLRTVPDASVIEQVKGIDADVTFCRSADILAPAQFPGLVRFIMEGSAAPLPSEQHWIVLQQSIFHLGDMPDMTDAQARALSDAFAPAWRAISERPLETAPASWRDSYGIDASRRVVALPLEYEHPENFFAIHFPTSGNYELVLEAAQALGEDIFLAVTNHPLNELHGSDGPVRAAVESLGTRAAIIRAPQPGQSATAMLAADCDGVILNLSKSYRLFARMACPMLLQNGFPSADWLNAYRDVDAFQRDIITGTARRPDPLMSRRWYEWHIANAVIDVKDDSLSLSRLIDHATRAFAPERWDHAVDRYRRLWLEPVPC